MDVSPLPKRLAPRPEKAIPPKRFYNNPAECSGYSRAASRGSAGAPFLGQHYGNDEACVLLQKAIVNLFAAIRRHRATLSRAELRALLKRSPFEPLH